jgi:hypothetical protein
MRGKKNRTPAHSNDHDSIYKLVAKNINRLRKRPSCEVSLFRNVDKVRVVEIEAKRRHFQCVVLLLKMAPEASPLRQAASPRGIHLWRSSSQILVRALPI